MRPAATSSLTCSAVKCGSRSATAHGRRHHAQIVANRAGSSARNLQPALRKLPAADPAFGQEVPGRLRWAGACRGCPATKGAGLSDVGAAAGTTPGWSWLRASGGLAAPRSGRVRVMAGEDLPVLRALATLGAMPERDTAPALIQIAAPAKAVDAVPVGAFGSLCLQSTFLREGAPRASPVEMGQGAQACPLPQA